MPGQSRISSFASGKGHTYSNDLRRVAILLRFEDGKSIDDISELLRMSPSSIYRYIKLFMETGEVNTKRIPKENLQALSRIKITGAVLAYLDRILEKEPRLYLDEMQAKLEHYSGESFTFKAIIGALKRLG